MESASDGFLIGTRLPAAGGDLATEVRRKVVRWRTVSAGVKKRGDLPGADCRLSVVKPAANTCVLSIYTRARCAAVQGGDC